MGYNFNLEQNEAELLMNALQKQTNSLLTKMQAQFAEQTKEEDEAEAEEYEAEAEEDEAEEDEAEEDQLLVEEGEDGSK